MASRTYIPTAIRFLRRTCKYLLDHRERIETVVGTGGTIHDAVQAVLDACEALTETLNDAIEHGS